MTIWRPHLREPKEYETIKMNKTFNNKHSAKQMKKLRQMLPKGTSTVNTAWPDWFVSHEPATNFTFTETTLGDNVKLDAIVLQYESMIRTKDSMIREQEQKIENQKSNMLNERKIMEDMFKALDMEKVKQREEIRLLKVTIKEQEAKIIGLEECIKLLGQGVAA